MEFLRPTAGNTHPIPPSCFFISGQPRVRGEHMAAYCCTVRSAGSAPRARGTLQMMRGLGGQMRVSPACAGNTEEVREVGFAQPGQPRVRGDQPGQPRVRGEHLGAPGKPGWLSGSAPRARGTPEGKLGSLPRRRVSPACAGNTLRTVFCNLVIPGQPRVRGEHTTYNDLGNELTGSAPRARGTLWVTSSPGASNRVSPACAGNTT